MPFIERKATLAQLVERLIRNQQVASSILAGGSNPLLAFHNPSQASEVGFNWVQNMSIRLFEAAQASRV
jgi:hypothetical protein